MQLIQAVVTALCLLVGSVTQALAAPWIHVQVDEPGSGGAKVHVTVPLSLARVALDMAGPDAFAHGRVKLENTEVTVPELRKAWEELLRAGDADFVTIQDAGNDIRISRKAGLLLLDVAARGAGGETVQVRLPNAVVGALLSGEGDELNLEAALQELTKAAPGDLVRVDDGGGTHVRVWIE